MQEWIDAVMTTEWLLGASMALGGKKVLTWIRDVREEFARPAGEGGETDETRPARRE